MGSSQHDGKWVSSPKKGKAETGRGATKMGKILRARHRGVVFELSWNQNGLPIGKDSEKVARYWGTLIRQNVPITIKTWKEVPERLLDGLFEDVVLACKIEPKKRKFMMEKVDAAWRNFKSSLSRLWIWTPEGTIREKPPDQYNFIKLTDWKDFVKSRITKNWKDKSEAARKAAKRNLYPQKRARRGYARFEQDVIKELAKKKIYKTSIGRGQLWTLIRTDRDGNVVEGAKAIDDRIDYYMRLSEQGRLEDNGREDVLSKALGKKEHGGRVRGVGVGVKNMDYFGSLQSKKVYMDQVTKLWSHVRTFEDKMKRIKRARSEGENIHSDEEEDEEENLEAFKSHENEEDDFEAFKSHENEEEDFEALKTHENRDNCTASVIELPEGVTPCQVALSNPTYRLVTRGKLHNFKTGTSSHTTPIPDGYVRVAIDYALEESTPLPVPIEGEAAVISEALGTLVLWPIELVVLDKMVNSSKDQHKEGGSLKMPTTSKRQKVAIFPKDQDEGAIKLPIPNVTKSQKVLDSSNDRDKQGGIIKTTTPSQIESQTVVNKLKNQDKHGGFISTPTYSSIQMRKVVNYSKDQDKQGGSIETSAPSPNESQKEPNTAVPTHTEFQKVSRNWEERVVFYTLPDQLFFCYRYALRMDNSEQVLIPINIGISTQSKTIPFGEEEIFEFLAQEQIGVCQLLPYMSKIYYTAGVSGVSNLFGFLCPSGISLMSQSQVGEVKKVQESRKKKISIYCRCL